ncbi:hypothetical protein [Streptomyces sp. NPDC057257]|uniref:hypothetical protein n=1 Tax=Streptomyces sp. NPDC057257 TaxID=3346071 RepID=UPI00362BA5DB
MDLRKPQDYCHRIWSIAIRAADVAEAGSDQKGEYGDMCTVDEVGHEQGGA